MKTILVKPDSETLTPAQAHNDGRVISLWLRGQQSPHAKEAHSRDLYTFLTFSSKPLHQTTLEDVQNYVDSLKRARLSQPAIYISGEQSYY